MPNAELSERLVTLSQKVEKAKTTRDHLQGEQRQLLKRLKEEFGCKDLAEGKKKYAKLKEELAELESRIEKELSALEKLESDHAEPTDT